jgi:tetratricopeptide (TPR) repeat protein
MAIAEEASKRGDHAIAAKMYDMAATQTTAFGPDDLRMASTLLGSARSYHALQNYTLAETNYRRALAVLDTAGGNVNGWLIGVAGGLADLYRMQGRHVEAEALYKRELTALEASFGPEHPTVAQSLTNNLGGLYRAQRRVGDVEALYKRSLSILEKATPENDARQGLALIDLADLYVEQQRYPEAEPYFRRGIPIVQKSLPTAHPRVVSLIQDWGMVMQMQARYRDAEVIYKALLSLVEKTYGAQHANVATVLNSLVNLYEVQGRLADADVIRERMIAFINTPFRGQPQAPYRARR